MFAPAKIIDYFPLLPTTPYGNSGNVVLPWLIRCWFIDVLINTCWIYSSLSKLRISFRVLYKNRGGEAPQPCVWWLQPPGREAVRSSLWLHWHLSGCAWEAKGMIGGISLIISFSAFVCVCIFTGSTSRQILYCWHLGKGQRTVEIIRVYFGWWWRAARIICSAARICIKWGVLLYRKYGYEKAEYSHWMEEGRRTCRRPRRVDFFTTLMMTHELPELLATKQILLQITNVLEEAINLCPVERSVDTDLGSVL